MKACIVCFRTEAEVSIRYIGPMCRKCREAASDETIQKLSSLKVKKESNTTLYRTTKSKEFRNNPKNKSKLKKYYLKYNYGLTLEAFNSLVEGQNGKCAICKNENSRKGDTRLLVDHDHKTGVIRGLLCHHCNAGLGYFKDNENSLETAITYLKRK